MGDKLDGFLIINPALALPTPQPFPASIYKQQKTEQQKTQQQKTADRLWTVAGFQEAGITAEQAVVIPTGIVTISLLNGTANQKDKVRRYAPDWRRAAPIIRYRFVDGLHGYVRVAFDDAKTPQKKWQGQKDLPFERIIDDMTWAYIGRDSFDAFDTPENVHIGRIQDKPISETPSDILTEEKKYIHHAFGHVLGLAFAGEVPGPLWQDYVVKTVVPKLRWVRSDVKAVVANPERDPKLKDPSVMGFGWRSDITFNDWARIAELYPIRAKTLRTSIRDIAERNSDHDEDLDLYVFGLDNRIYRNRRHYKKKDHEVTWTYWSDVLEESPLDVPLDCKDIAILDLADRLEILAVTKGENLLQNYQIKGSNEWKTWRPFKHGNDPISVSKLKILEVEGGYEVIYIKGGKDTGKLAHFTRKNGDPELNTEFHPIPVQNSISKIVAARVGPPTNPMKIYAASGKDIYCAELDNKTLTWTLTSVNAEQKEIVKSDLAFGMAGTTENAFFIDVYGKLWHNKNLNGGWVDWDDGLPLLPKGVQLKSISVGEASTRDAESRYLQVFVLAVSGEIYYNRVHEEGGWGPSSDVDSAGNPDWINLSTPGKTLVGLKNAPKADDIYTKRAKCGDLELFVVEKDTKQIHRVGITNAGFKDSAFVPRIWGTLEKLED